MMDLQKKLKKDKSTKKPGLHVFNTSGCNWKRKWVDILFWASGRKKKEGVARGVGGQHLKQLLPKEWLERERHDLTSQSIQEDAEPSRAAAAAPVANCSYNHTKHAAQG